MLTTMPTASTLMRTEFDIHLILILLVIVTDAHSDTDSHTRTDIRINNYKL